VLPGYLNAVYDCVVCGCGRRGVRKRWVEWFADDACRLAGKRGKARDGAEPRFSGTTKIIVRTSISVI